MRKTLFLYFLFIISYSSFAQQFGGNPPSMKWRQINTDTARIIFPAGLDSTAQRVASIIHYLAANNPAPLGNRVHKVNIVLQTQTTIANGYVGLAPFRSEYFLTPATNNFDLGSINWAEGLAIHEYRHVEQYNNFRRGFTNAFFYLFGEEGWLVGINASIPDWFFEGDAVYNETIVSNQGRGRIPFFLNQYKSLWLYNKHYSWMKLRNRSFKDYVPDHYALGYLLVNYGREKYGLDFWEKVTKDASGFRGLIYPFQKAVGRYAGVSYKTFRNQAFEYYKKLNGVGNDEVLATQQKPNQGTEAGIQDLTPLNKHFVTNYIFPYQAGPDSLIYLKNSYRQINEFFIKDAAGEHKLRVKDISNEQQFSYRNGKIVYAAYEPDTRWAWKDFSVIKLLDINTNKERTLLHRTKYFTPDISDDGQKIAASYIIPGARGELHILDANDGKILQRFRSTEIDLFTDPKFINANQLVTAVRLHDGKMALAIADIAVGSVERLTIPSYAVLGFPSVNDSVIYFTASYSGNDEICAVRLKDRKVFQLTQTQLGNYYVNASGGKLIWSAFTAEGYQLKELDIKNGMWTEIDDLAITAPATFFPVAHSGELHDLLLNDIPQRKFSVASYQQGTHLLYVHGWRPYLADPDYYFSLYSDNIQNTLSAELYYHYNRIEKTNGFGFDFLYGALYPYINGGFEYKANKPVYIGQKFDRIHQLEVAIGASLPVNFTRGRNFRFLSIGSNYILNRQVFMGALKDSLGSVNFSYLSHSFSFSQSIQRATQHIYPHFGYNVFVNFRHPLNVYKGYQLSASGAIFLPGFYPTHNIILTGAFHQRDTSNIIFSSYFANSRGYNNYNFSRMWRFSANYHFPLLYPDWGFGNIAYLNRVRANVFYDIARVFSNNKKESRDMRSVGAEIYFDTKWWNEYSLSVGMRYSHVLDNELVGHTFKNVFEILVPIVIPK
jgi:hypothetical protein